MKTNYFNGCTTPEELKKNNVQPQNTIAEIRTTHTNLIKVGDRFPVIILTVYSVKQSIYGVQYWTTQMISQGTQINTDKTISKFVEFF